MTNETNESDGNSTLLNTQKWDRRVLIGWIAALLVVLLILIGLIETQAYLIGKQGWTTDINDLHGYIFWDMTYDKEGNLWAATSDGLTMLTQEGKWAQPNHAYNTESYPVQILALAFDDKGNPWIGTSEELYWLAPDRGWISYSRDNSGLNSFGVNTVVFDEIGNLWVGGNRGWSGNRGGLDRLSPDGTWTAHLTNQDVNTLIFDNNSNLWVGTDKGLHMMSPDEKWTSYTTTNSDLTNDEVNALVFDKTGNLWISTENGLNMLAQDGKWITYGIYTAAINPAHMIFDEKENLWFGTDQGLGRLAPDGKWTIYTTANSGLNDEKVYGLIIDKEDNLLIGTYQGLSRVNLNEIRTIEYDIMLHSIEPIANIARRVIPLFLVISIILILQISFKTQRQLIVTDTKDNAPIFLPPDLNEGAHKSDNSDSAESEFTTNTNKTA